MKRALSIFTAGLMGAPVAIAQESAEGLEVAELSRKEDVDFATEILPIFRKNQISHNKEFLQKPFTFRIGLYIRVFRNQTVPP